jgi:DNA protecting protein DprA
MTSHQQSFCGIPMTWLAESQGNEQARGLLHMLAHVIEPGDTHLGALLWRDGPDAVVREIEARDRHGGLRARLHACPDPAAGTNAIGARIVTALDREWPTQLNELGPARPIALWVLGAANLRTMAVYSVAFVGARAATPYGERVCADWVSRCCDQGITIISGGAAGIDAAAHRAALNASGMTVAVLASGVDVPYPRGNAALFADIANAGLLISESPPGTGVRRQRFLTRNRVIAALTRATVVVEAALRSGTTSTANAAVALNRPLLAVPGPVTSPQSAGCHHLIATQQAVIALESADVLTAVGTLTPGTPIERRPWDDLSPPARAVLDALPVRGPMDLAALTAASGHAVTAVLAATGELLARGLISQHAAGFQRTPGTSPGKPASVGAR